MPKEMHIVSGAEMVSRGAMDAGVNFFAGYPITPASGVYVAMLEKLQAQGKVALPVADEISAISICLGASLRGAKAMTATSGPGFSLMIENLSYAFMAEIPFVLVLSQRLGPSTGAATQSAEGDILLAANFISGGYRIPVLAPNSIHSCYETTFRAVNISEKYRTPVIVLTEKDILMSTANVDPSTLPKLSAVERKRFEGENYRPYDFDKAQDVPAFINAGSDTHRAVITGSLHNKDGVLTKTSPESLEVLKHLRAKIEDNAEDMTFCEKDFDEGAQICLISFLATDLSARQAIQEARKLGIQIKHLSLQTLLPLPSNSIKEAIADCHTVLIPEENDSGQYASLILQLLEGKNLVKITHTGSLIPPKKILEALTQLQSNISAKQSC